MKKLLVVVDMQNDFITGSLGNPSAEKLIPDMVKYIEDWDGDLVFTRDTHQENYMDTQEGKNLPVPHCIEGTEGWQIAEALLPYTEKAKIFDKPTFGSTKLAEYISEKQYEEVVFTGVCTGICVISNVLLTKAFCTETKVSVVENLCACVTEETHMHAIEAMKTCQVKVI